MKSLLINIDVPDLQAATFFYTNAFTLKLGRKFGDSGVELLGLASPIYLLKKEEGTEPFPQATETRSYERHWSPVHLDFSVSNIDVAIQRAVDSGATIERPTESNTWGKIAMLADPFGNGFCLIEFSERGYDEIATR